MAKTTKYRCLPVTRQAKRRNSEAGAMHPAFPAVILLMCFAVFMAAIAPLNFSSILRKLFPTPSQTVPHQSAAVWVDNNAGVYYCAGSIMFGRARGEYMKQVDALDHGYQPALGTYCNGPDWGLPSQRVHPHVDSSPSPTPETAGHNPFENPQSQSGGLRAAPPPSTSLH